MGAIVVVFVILAGFGAARGLFYALCKGIGTIIEGGEKVGKSAGEALKDHLRHWLED